MLCKRHSAAGGQCHLIVARLVVLLESLLFVDRLCILMVATWVKLFLLIVAISRVVRVLMIMRRSGSATLVV